ncbi:sensor histidine kinase [Sphingomonas sp. S2-65]|uniref:sensor histidine kinase n=1 Tax=Sphingomonas sp. S2-65 TaxID=2903960 RepID=UPI001F1FAF77|nr:ATP-binding protein [Sphingomonas sp. S2-65]UYY57878.1 ATP-binding protein [Sphingomonas sp. S2-65]
MGFDRRFTAGLIGWIVALGVAVLALGAALLTPGLGAARVVALGLAAGAFAGLWRHVTRTNRAVARFVEALRFNDISLRFDAASGAGFGQLSGALNDAMARFGSEQNRLTGELRYVEALVDDMPVAVLTIDARGQVTLANKAARRLFAAGGTTADSFAAYGATFAKRLASESNQDELMINVIDGRPQRVLVRSTSLDRLGHRTRVVTVQPLGGTLDTVEMAAQTDLVRVLTHEILNSLTPVTSLAATADELLAGADLNDPRIGDARLAVATLARRAAGLGNFIEAYRAVARTPEIKRVSFAAHAWAGELARLFAAQSPDIPLLVDVPESLVLEGDPDLLAQVLINLLRNGAQAVRDADRAPCLVLRILDDRHGTAIEVEDNGPGIPESLRQDIFLPFFTTRTTGTGVGLNLARQIVVAHGGTIDVTDAPGGGALFRILL